jgi:hypothetical protein
LAESEELFAGTAVWSSRKLGKCCELSGTSMASVVVDSTEASCVCACEAVVGGCRLGAAVLATDRPSGNLAGNVVIWVGSDER